VHTAHAGNLSTSLTVGTMTVEQMLRAQVTNTIVLLEGALVTTNDADRPTITTLKCIGINMVSLSQETLYIL